MFRSSIEKKLTSMTSELRSLREELIVIEEQLVQVSDEADDLRLRALVSETPLSEAEHREAAKAVAAVRRDRDGAVEKIERLEQKQDELLDRLGTSGGRR